MIEPALADQAFLDSVHRGRADAGWLRLWWLGQSGYLLTWGGRSLLVDPYLSDSLTRKYAETDKPHVRMTRRVVDPARLDFIEVVTSSHAHTDHLDAETLQPLFAANPALRLVAPESNRKLSAERAGIDPGAILGLDDGETLELDGLQVTAIASAHETIERDVAGHCKYLGYVFRLGGHTLYHSGDTVLHDGLVERLRPLQVDVALLPINGANPERRVSGNLSGPEAAQLAHDMGARVVIPCHYEMFEFNTASPAAFVAACDRLEQPCVVLRAGESWGIPA